MAAVQTYYQADEPSDTTPGTTWLRADGTKAQRGLSAEWIEKGSWTLEDDGLLSKEGGAVTGPVTGNHGHAPIDSPAFTTIITLDGEEVPDKPWVTEQLTNLEESLQNFITESLGAGSSISVGNNLAFGYGEIYHGATVPLPKYSDDTRATVSEVCLLMASCRGGSEAGVRNVEYIDPSTLIVSAYNTDSTANHYPHYANYIIVCKR